MSLEDMDRDLGLWEAGRLSRDHVEARHGVEVATLMNLHEQFAAIAAEPIPYNESSWETLVGRLPDRIKSTSSQLRRVVALAAAAVLFIGAVSYAAVSPVRRQTDRIFREISDLIVGGDEPDISVGPPGPGTQPPAAGSNGLSPSDDGDEEGNEGPGSDDDADEGNEGPDSDDGGDDEGDEEDEGSGSDDGEGGGSGSQDPDDEPDGDGSGSDDSDDSGSGSGSGDSDDEESEGPGSGDEGGDD